MAIPSQFNDQGVLAPETYDATLSELKKSVLIHGSDSKTWDAKWRSHLLDNAAILIDQLWRVGITDIFLDGSFVEDKDHPNDIDGYFDPHLSLYSPTDIDRFSQIVSDLNNLDPHKVWDWDQKSRRAVPGFSKLQLPMWIFYRVEFYPHLGQGTGITDAYGIDLKFPSAFRQSRNGFLQKGIVKIIR